MKDEKSTANTLVQGRLVLTNDKLFTLKTRNMLMRKFISSVKELLKTTIHLIFKHDKKVPILIENEEGKTHNYYMVWSNNGSMGHFTLHKTKGILVEQC